MKNFVPHVLGALLAVACVSAGAAEFAEGKEFSRLKNPQPVETGKKIEVIEFFSYGCPHCNDLEPFLQQWLKTASADVQFRRVPVMFQDRWKALARDYYTLDAMGEDTRLSPALFQALHGAGMPLYQDKVFFDWAASKGLDRKQVVEIYNSSGIGAALARLYANRGDALGLFARRAEALEALATTLKPARCAIYPGDVRDPVAMREAAADYQARFGVPHLVVASAGISVGTSI